MRLFPLNMIAVAVIVLSACGGGKGGMGADELDPDTAAAVRRVNLEKYSGDWLFEGAKGSVYISIDQDGYYILQMNKNNSIRSGDFGRIDHRSPGKMLLYSARGECPGSDEPLWLWMDRDGDAVRLVNSRDEDQTLDLLATDKRERLRGLPCESQENRQVSSN